MILPYCKSQSKNSSCFFPGVKTDMFLEGSKVDPVLPFQKVGIDHDIFSFQENMWRSIRGETDRIGA